MANVHFNRDILHGRSLLSFLIMNQVHNTTWFKEMPEIFGKMSQEESDKFEVDVKLFFNGEEIDIVSEFKRIDDELDGVVEKLAIQLVKAQTSEKLQNVQRKIQDLEQIVEEMATDITWDSLYDGTQLFKK